MIIFGAIEYMTSKAFLGKSAGREKIKNALMGITFLIVGYIILLTINPDILNIGMFKEAPTVSFSINGANSKYKVTLPTPGELNEDEKEEDDWGDYDGKENLEKDMKREEMNYQDGVDGGNAQDMIQRANDEARWWGGRSCSSSQDTIERVNQY
jgi:hypothetical protein